MPLIFISNPAFAHGRIEFKERRLGQIEPENKAGPWRELLFDQKKNQIFLGQRFRPSSRVYLK